MINASLYIIACSARNRATRRLRRLREPRYLVGAFAAGAYIVFQVLGVARARRGGDALEIPPYLEAVLPTLAAAALLLVAGLAWLVPSGGGGVVQFSEAEVQFLLPAPVSRRQLLIHRLLRSQLGLLFAAMVPALFFGYAGGSFPARMLRWVSLWLVLLTARVYFTGVALVRGRLIAPTPGASPVPWAPLVVALGAIATLGAAVAREFLSGPVAGVDDVFTRIKHAVDTAPAAIVLWPFTTLVRPLFTSPSLQFVTALVPAIAVLGATLVWVLRNDDMFQESAARVTRRRAERRGRAASPPRLRAGGWLLPLSGRTETVFFWKNSMQTLRRTSVGTFLQYATPAVLLGAAFAGARMSEADARGLATALSTFALIVAAFVMLIGPQIMSADLRSDLRHLPLLKTWPVRPAAVVRGEMLWPGIVVTSIGWLALLCAASFSAAAFPDRSVTWRLSVAAAAIVLVPACVFAQYTVHNAAAVLFPAWAPLDDQRPRGLDAMGQRMILLAGVVVALAVAIAPGAVAGGVVGLVLYRFVGVVSLVPAAAVCLAIVGIEVVIATEALGVAYERIDLTEVERAE